MKGTLLILPMLALLSWVACSEQAPSPTEQGGGFSAGQPRNQLPQQESASQAMEGTLTKVNPDTKRISIRIADGSERSFSYSDSTLIVGSEDTIEGLGRMNGARIRVEYTLGGQGNQAEKVEVLTGQASTPPAGGTY